MASPASYTAPVALPKIEHVTYPSSSHPLEPAHPAPMNSYNYEAPQPVAGSKRAYGSTFSTQSIEKPLRQGARPSTVSLEPSYNLGSLEADDDSLDESAMSYRRADGTQRRRKIPTF